MQLFALKYNTMSKQIIKTDKAPAPIGPYNQAVIANGFLFISGQVAIDPATNEVIKGTVRRNSSGNEKPESYFR